MLSPNSEENNVFTELYRGNHRHWVSNSRVQFITLKEIPIRL